MLKKDPGEIIRLIINIIAFAVFLVFGIQQINASEEIAGKVMLSILILPSFSLLYGTNLCEMLTVKQYMR
jgi:uncharacterized membrane protein